MSEQTSLVTLVLYKHNLEALELQTVDNQWAVSTRTVN